ncbi:hypothetical protein [Dongia sp.]
MFPSNTGAWKLARLQERRRFFMRHAFLWLPGVPIPLLIVIWFLFR